MQHVTNILRQRITLNVNSNWRPLGYMMVRSAFTALNGGADTFGVTGQPPARAFIIDYGKDEEGFYDFDQLIECRPIDWSEWIKQPIRGHDSVVHTSKLEIRVPTVIMSVNMNEDPVIKKGRPTNRDILIRDGYVCQYTNKKYPPSQLTVDHVISKDEWRRRGLPGSPDTWENMVACYKPLNHEKSNKTLAEMGLKLIRKPKAPPAVRLSELIREIRHQDWKHFFEKYQDMKVNIGNE
jgi:5-methylcytosine-specific restriction endonuclease McrA